MKTIVIDYASFISGREARRVVRLAPVLFLGLPLGVARVEIFVLRVEFVGNEG